MQRLSFDELTVVLEFADIKTINAFRLASRRSKAIADGNALWSHIARHRGQCSMISMPSSTPSATKDFVRSLCLGAKRLDGANESSVAETSSLWLPVAYCGSYGHLHVPSGSADGKLPSGLQQLRAAVAASVEAPDRVCTLAMVVITIVVPRFDLATAATVDSIARDVLGVDYIESDEAPSAPAFAGAEELARRYDGVPQRFSSLSLHRVQRRAARKDGSVTRLCLLLLHLPMQDMDDLAASQIQRRAQSDGVDLDFNRLRDYSVFSFSRRDRKTPELSAHPRGGGAMGATPDDAAGSWFDPRGANAANGRLFAVALAVSSSIVVVGSRGAPWVQWHARLRPAMRDAAHDFQQQVARHRGEMPDMLYVIVECARRTTVNGNAAADAAGGHRDDVGVAFFDPLRELVPLPHAHDAEVVSDPNWFEFALVHHVDRVRGVELTIDESEPWPSRRLKRLPPEASEMLCQAASRRFSRAPQMTGSSIGGGFAFVEWASHTLSTVERAANPAASISGIIAAPNSAVMFGRLVSHCKRFYETAMQIEVVDIARPCEPFWVNAVAETRRVSKRLEKCYSSGARRDHPSALGSSTAARSSDPYDEGGEGDDDPIGSRHETDDDDRSESGVGHEPSLDEFIPVDAAAIVQRAVAGVTSSPEELEVPMESHELFEAYERFSVAALRMLMLKVTSSFGEGASVDAITADALMNSLENQMSTSFRAVASANAVRSRRYCGAVARAVFQPILGRFGAGAPALSTGSDAVVIRTWYQSVREKIEEYVVKARGPQRFDELWGCLSQSVIPAFEAAMSAAHASALPDVSHAAASLSLEVRGLAQESARLRSEAAEVADRRIVWLKMLIRNQCSALVAERAETRLATLLDASDIDEWHHVRADKLARLAPARETRWLQNGFPMTADSDHEAIAAQRNRLDETRLLLEKQIWGLQQRLADREAATIPQVRHAEREERHHTATGVVALYNALNRLAGNGSQSNHS